MRQDDVRIEEKRIMNEGNNVFPSGNALKYLGEYFQPPGEIDLTLPCGSVPYTESTTSMIDDDDRGKAGMRKEIIKIRRGEEVHETVHQAKGILMARQVRGKG